GPARHVLRWPRQEDALRHRVLRGMGNAVRPKSHHRDSNDRAGLYRTSEVACTDASVVRNVIQVGYSTPTAREIRSITMHNDRTICTDANSFAHRANNGASVGPNVELCVNAMNR